MKNGIRTSRELATAASYTLSGKLDDAFVQELVDNLLCLPRQSEIEQLVKSLAGSVLVNRKA